MWENVAMMKRVVIFAPAQHPRLVPFQTMMLNIAKKQRAKDVMVVGRMT